MTEEGVRERIRAAFGMTAYQRMEQFVRLIVEENERQNLIARSTIDTIWSRHIWDSLQLIPHARGAEGMWIDIGSGGGFPGLPIAIVQPGPMMLVEPRRLRSAFIASAVEQIGLSRHVTICPMKIERVQTSAIIISARAVAGIERLLEIAHHCATPTTRWLLPRGRLDPAEIKAAKDRWRFMFHVEQSDVADSSILILEGVERR